MKTQKKSGYIWAVLLVIVAAHLQYAVSALMALSQGHASVWVLGQKTDIEKYSRDLIFILFNMYCVFFAVRKRMFVVAIMFVVFFMLLGGVMIVAHDLPNVFLLSGFRWLNALLVAISVYFVISSMSSSQYEKFTVYYVRFVWFLAITCVLAAWIELQLLGNLRFGIRVFGIYSQAAMMGYASIGLALSLLLITTRYKAALLALVLLMAMLSGTRVAMIIVLLVLTVNILTLSGLRNTIRQTSIYTKGVVFLLSILVFFILFAGLVSFSSSIAGRGNLLEQQGLDGGGGNSRGGKLISLGRELSDSPWHVSLLGVGLGAGTNTLYQAYQGNLSSLQYPEILLKFSDNTFAAWVQQFGVLGLILLIAVVMKVFHSVYIVTKVKGVYIETIILFFSTLLISFAQNILESPTIMIGVSLYLAFLFNKVFKGKADMRLRGTKVQ